MEREDILRVLQAHPDNCIRAFHRGRPGRSGYLEGKVLIRHYGGLVPEEIVLKPVMFLKVRDRLVVSDTWGSSALGGCTWRLADEAPAAPAADGERLPAGGAAARCRRRARRVSPGYKS